MTLLFGNINMHLAGVWKNWCFKCDSGPSIIWASTRENDGFEKHRRRPACASAQSDQRLCFSLFGKNHIQTCYERNFNYPASLCSWAGWFESHFVGNPEDRCSRVTAHLESDLWEHVYRDYTVWLSPGTQYINESCIRDSSWAAIQGNQTSGVEFLVWFEVLLPSLQLWSYQGGQFT